MTTEYAPEPLQTVPGEAPGRDWVITTDCGFTVNGYLPEWAEEDPSTTDVPLSRLPVALDDIAHRALFDGVPLQIAPGGHGPGEKRDVFAGTFECRPHPDEGRPAVPSSTST